MDIFSHIFAFPLISISVRSMILLSIFDLLMHHKYQIDIEKYILIFNYLFFFSVYHYTSRNSPFRQPRVLPDLPEWETPGRGGERNESK